MGQAICDVVNNNICLCEGGGREGEGGLNKIVIYQSCSQTQMCPTKRHLLTTSIC